MERVDRSLVLLRYALLITAAAVLLLVIWPVIADRSLAFAGFALLMALITAGLAVLFLGLGLLIARRRMAIVAIGSIGGGVALVLVHFGSSLVHPVALTLAMMLAGLAAGVMATVPQSRRPPIAAARSASRSPIL